MAKSATISGKEVSEVYTHTKVKSRINLIQYIRATEKISYQEASAIVEDDGRFSTLIGNYDKRLRHKMVSELIPRAVVTFHEELEDGNVKNAKEAAVIIGILRDKAMGQDKYSTPIRVQGKNVQINLGFKFKPYTEKQEKKKIKKIKEKK